MEALLYVLIDVFGELPMETRAKALQALVEFLPNDAEQQYPDLWRYLCKYRGVMELMRAPPSMFLDMDTLIETLAPVSESVPLESHAESSQSCSCGCFTM